MPDMEPKGKEICQVFNKGLSAFQIRAIMIESDPLGLILRLLSR